MSDEFYDYENGSVLIDNPVPILQQPFSKDVTTNAFLTGLNKPEYNISLGQKLNNFGEELNKKINQETNSVIALIPEDRSINVNNFSINMIECMDDLLNKPEDIFIIKKKERLVYIGLLILMIIILSAFII
jgi:hypothetical protein